MVLYVHRDANLKKQLKALRQARGRAALVAEHADAIMDRLILEGNHRPRQVGRVTKHGEARIKNCIKYDMIDGYRLIGIKQGSELVFLYIGTHDECDRWIRNNSGLRSLGKRKRTRFSLSMNAYQNPNWLKKNLSRNLIFVKTLWRPSMIRTSGRSFVVCVASKMEDLSASYYMNNQ